MFFRRRQLYFSSILHKNIRDLEAGDLHMIPLIFCVFSENSFQHKVKAAQALKKVLENLSFQRICEIDVKMRQKSSMEWSINWRKLEIQSFLTPQMSIEEKRAVLIFSSFNPNGFIRQKAVELLSSYDFTLPFIILRLNDWVHEVRQSAKNAFSSRLALATEQEFLHSFFLLEKLRRSERCEYPEIFDLFYHEISIAKNKHLLETGLNSRDEIIRKYCIRILLLSPDMNYQILEDHIKKENVPILRKMTFQLLVKAKEDFPELRVDLLELCESLQKDRYPANRKMALDYLYEFNKDIAFQKVNTMVLDHNSSVRFLARKIYHELDPHAVFSKFYRENIMQNPACAILGLGETGSPEDCAVIEQYLCHCEISVVRASMISLMRLNAEKYRTDIVEMLLSDKIGIVKTAKQLIAKCNMVDFERIYEIYQESTHEKTKIVCASLLFSAGKWKRLIYILMILDSELPALQAMSQCEIRKWIDSYNRTFTTATENQKKQIKDLLHSPKNRLNEEIQSQLRFLVE